MATIHMTPAQHAALKDAGRPIGSAADAVRELENLLIQSRNLAREAEHARETYAATVRLPDGTPDDHRAAVTAEAERALRIVEDSARSQLTVIAARVRGITSQLDDAAATPSLNGVASATLDDANRVAPIYRAELDGAPLSTLRERLKAAVIRDDDGELLGLTLALRPILDRRRATPDDAGSDDAYALFDLADMLKHIGERWRDGALDAALTRAAAVEEAVARHKRDVTKGFTDRTGEDEFGFGRAWGLAS